MSIFSSAVMKCPNFKKLQLVKKSKEGNIHASCNLFQGHIVTVKNSQSFSLLLNTWEMKKQ